MVQRYPAEANILCTPNKYYREDTKVESTDGILKLKLELLKQLLFSPLSV